MDNEIMVKVAKSEVKKHKHERIMLISFLALAFITTIFCSYGYAAFESDLQISGEGIIKQQINFSSAYMQDVTPTECAGVDIGQTKRLIDKRDGKLYWVAKMKDGNCWMVQSLDYDLVAGTILTPNDSDVQNNYRVITSTDATLDWRRLSGSALDAAVYAERSWDVGEYVLATPTKDLSCRGDNTMMSANQPVTPEYMRDVYNSIWPREALSHCSDFQEVAGWQPTFEARAGTWQGKPAGNGSDFTATGLVAADAASRTYDAHYLVGNYYQFNAATLGSAPASVVTKVDTTRSVCPKGWKLPTSGNIGTPSAPFVNQNGSFYNLLAQYGYGNAQDYIWNGGVPYAYAILGSAADNFQNNLTASPIYLVRGGGVHLDTGSMRFVGSNSAYWTATTYANIPGQSYFLALSSSVYPALYDGRLIGYPVRCVLR